MKYCSALKRKKILTDATTWVKFEDIMRSEIRQSKTKRQMLCYSLIQGIEISQIQRQK